MSIVGPGSVLFNQDDLIEHSHKEGGACAHSGVDRAGADQRPG